MEAMTGTLAAMPHFGEQKGVKVRCLVIGIATAILQRGTRGALGSVGAWTNVGC